MDKEGGGGWGGAGGVCWGRDGGIGEWGERAEAEKENQLLPPQPPH